MAKKTAQQKLPQNEQESLKDKGGRPTLYNEDIARRVCQLVATTTIGVRKLCKLHDDLPNPDTIYNWRYYYPEFSERWNEAMVHRAQLLAEEVLEISDNTYSDWITDDEGREVFNKEHLLRTKLRCDNRRWIASKLAKHLYGEKSETTVTINKHEDALAALK